MHRRETAIAGCAVLTPARHRDARGFLSETFKASVLEGRGLAAAFVQENHTLSIQAGIVRGLHFQVPPDAQAKLVRVARGAVYDVAVDLRRSSPTYGSHVAVELSAETGAQLYIPAGCAHGVCTLTAGAELIYLATREYAPDSEAGLAWDDPDLAIPWPVAPAAAILSERDRALPCFRDFRSPFP